MTNESKKWWSKSRLDPVLNLIGEGPPATLSVPSFSNDNNYTLIEEKQQEYQVQQQQPVEQDKPPPIIQIATSVQPPPLEQTHSSSSTTTSVRPNSTKAVERKPADSRRRKSPSRKRRQKSRKVLHKGMWIEIPMANSSSSRGVLGSSSRRRKKAEHSPKRRRRRPKKEAMPQPSSPPRPAWNTRSDPSEVGGTFDSMRKNVPEVRPSPARKVHRRRREKNKKNAKTEDNPKLALKDTSNIFNTAKDKKVGTVTTSPSIVNRSPVMASDSSVVSPVMYKRSQGLTHKATPRTATPRTATPRTATPRTATPRTATPRTATPTSRGKSERTGENKENNRHSSSRKKAHTSTHRSARSQKSSNSTEREKASEQPQEKQEELSISEMRQMLKEESSSLFVTTEQLRNISSGSSHPSIIAEMRGNANDQQPRQTQQQQQQKPPVPQVLARKEEEDRVTLDVMLEQLYRMEEREQQVMERFKNRQKERYNRLKKIEEEEEIDLFEQFDGGVNIAGQKDSDPSADCDDISWSQIRSIEGRRAAFLNHRAIVESSLRGTGLSQAHIIEVIENLITTELIDKCSKEVTHSFNIITKNIMDRS
jgi:hypothetical protein